MTPQPGNSPVIQQQNVLDLYRVFISDGHFLHSVFGLVSVVSVDCEAPWRLQVNSELSWFHFSCPLVLLLLYNTVASLWRNQVT